MLRAALFPALLLFSACGGGGGGGPTVTAAVRLAAVDIDLAASTTSAELAVSLVHQSTTAPAMLQVAIELPPALTVALGDPLSAAQPLITLKGELRNGRYLVVLGDDRNRDALPLANGPLFRLRLATTTPRQVGTFQITLRDLLAAQSGGAPADFDVNPATATVTIR